jgi:hypothetical protein
MSKSNNLAILLFLIFSLFTSASNACSCDASLSFKQAFNYEQTDLVIHGRILAYIDFSTPSPQVVYSLKDGQHSARIQIEIINILKGVSDKTIIEVRGDGALDCIRYASNFPVGSEWLLAMQNKEISSCGEFALKIRGSKVVESNNIESYTKEKQSMKLTKLYKLLGIANPSGKRKKPKSTY